MRTFYYLLAIIVLSSCGGGGGGGGSGDSTPMTPAPSINFSAEPTSVLLGNTSTLTWTSTNASSCSASWTSSTSSSGSEAVTISTAGNNNFSISCNGAGGNSTASVTVEGYRNTDGVVVDGYISGAEVFIDENDNWSADSIESSSTSNNDGKFTIKYTNGNLVSLGGTDLDSQILLDNFLITHKLNGHSDFKVVTPVTSIAAFMADASLVNITMGIDSSIDIFTFDPVDNKGDGGINDYLYEKGNQLTVLAYAIQNITNDLNTSSETTQDYFKAIAEEIEKEYNETESKVDIETEAFVTKVFDNIITAKTVTIDEATKNNTAKVLAGVMPVIEVKTSDDLTTAIIRFAISTLQTDIQAIANGSATEEMLASYTNDIINYIAEDQNIDADKITPSVNAFSDSATTPEDTAITIDILVNDSYVTTAPINITFENGSSGDVSLAESYPEQLVYTPDANFNGTDTFSYTITQGDKTATADVTVTIESVNDLPTIDIASTILVDENQNGVTTISISDVDNDELSLSLSGTDSESFNLSSDNVLTFIEAPDYETKTSYSITLSVSDGIETVTKDVTIAINNLNDNPPIFSTSNTLDIEENIKTISTITAVDADGDSLVFSLKPNVNDNAELIITPDGILSFVTPADYETRILYTGTILVTDGVFSDELTIAINVTDANDNPPVIITTGFSSNENQSSIGLIEATDVDTNTVFSYSITGNDASYVSVNNDGVISFIELPDYETKSSYSITIDVSDGLNATSKGIIVQINNILEDVISSSFTISDGTSSQSPILNISLKLDELSGAKKVYAELEAIAETDDIGCYGSSGAMELVKNNSTDWSLTKELPSETSELCSYRVNYYFNFYNIETESVPPIPGIHLATGNKSMLNDNQYSTTYTTPLENKISISNVNSDNAVDNHNGFIHFLYSPSEEYPSICQTTSYTSGDYTSPLVANPTQECSEAMITNVSEDSTKIKYEFYINSVEPLSNAFSYIFAPMKSGKDNNNGRNDSLEVQTEVAEIQDSTTDSRIAKFTFELPIEAASENGDNMYFNVYALGKNQLLGSTNLWASTDASSIADMNPPELVSAEFSNFYDTSFPQRDFIKIDVETLNEAGDNGVITSLRDTWIATRGPTCNRKIFYVRDDFDGRIGTSVKDISATFPILKNELGTYQIESININDWGFAESSYYGIESDDDNKNSLVGSTFTAGDGTAASCPLFLNYKVFETITIDENVSEVGTFIAQGSQSDNIIYSIEDSDYTQDAVNQISTKLVISPSGQVTYKTPPDYDKEDDLDSGHFKIRATSSLDSSLSRVLYREIVLNNLNDNSPEIITTQMSAEENQTSIGCITHADKDVNVSATFACLNDNELGVSYSGDITFSISGDNISIVESTGLLSFDNAPDYEEVTSYVATVTINDGANSTTSDITINVLDLNDNPPVVTSSKSYSVKENQSSGGVIEITDPDTVNVFTFTIDETYEDGELFTINSSGELSFISNPDYETKNSYTVKVTINDGAFEITEEFSITLEDVIAEAIPTYADLNLLPQNSNTTSVQLLSYVIDGRTASYSIDVGPTYGTATLNPSTGMLIYTTDYSDIVVEKITFRVNDGVIDDGVADLTLNLNSDPAYKQSWYLDNTGQTAYSSRFGFPGEDLNTDTSISSGQTGQGIGINVIDEGLEIAHEDLVDNVKVGYSWDFENRDPDPTNELPYGDHGTSVAGIIAAKGWNNLGGRGVAPDADLIGYNFLNYQCSTCQTDSWGYNDDYAGSMDIFNMSYGSGNYYYNDRTTFRFPTRNTLTSLDDAALKNGVNNLRDEKGALYIKSMGNSFYSNATNGLGCGESGVDDEGAFGCSIRFHDEVHTTPYIIGVASLKATGVKSSYSTTDPSIWISGFGGEFGYNEDYRAGLVERAYEPAMITTDQSGCTAGYVSWYYLPRNRYNDWGYFNSPLDENSECNYTSTFNGTSAAAPSVAGGIAVLLGAYPNLTWRDVKHIMANTARKNDSTRSYSRNGLEQYNWNLNAAGYSHHYWYGFGAFDLGAAIDFASTYTPGSLGTFNEYGWEESEPIEVIEVSVEANTNGSGNVYVIDGTQKKSLTLNVGATYIFNHPSAHPLRFSTTDDGTHGGGVEYTNGVTTSDGVTTIEVKEAPITLYYYCDVHSGMGSDVSNIDEKRNVNLLLPSYTSVENKITYSVETTGDFVEFVQVKIYLDKDTPRDIGLHLISPQGTEKSILHPFSNVSGNPSGEWFIMGVAGFYGENINGDWSLKVTDYTDNDDVGTLIDWGINVFGN